MNRMNKTASEMAMYKIASYIHKMKKRACCDQKTLVKIAKLIKHVR